MDPARDQDGNLGRVSQGPEGDPNLGAGHTGPDQGGVLESAETPQDLVRVFQVPGMPVQRGAHGHHVGRSPCCFRRRPLGQVADPNRIRILAHSGARQGQRRGVALGILASDSDQVDPGESGPLHRMAASAQGHIHLMDV